MQDLQIQLDALIELRSFLIQFQEEIQTTQLRYYSRLRQIRDSGLSAQISDNYASTYAAENNQNFQNIIMNIREKDLPYINALIIQFEQALVRARAAH